MVRILFGADIFAKPGRRAAAEHIPRLLRDRRIDLCVVNGENAAGGFGLTESIVRKLHSYGADVVTTGNHVWQRKELVPHLNQSERLLRPLNYPPGAPGRGATVVRTRQGLPVAVVNLQGRTFLPSVDCPFRAARHELERLRRQTTLVVVDFHAEATAEKMALGWYLDGLATAVIGTHTHVQTADERILPQGTAYLTDAGMTGPHASVIGTRPELAIQRFLTQVPVQFKPADGQVRFCGALIEADEATGRAVAIERLQLEVEAGAADDGEGD